VYALSGALLFASMRDRDPHAYRSELAALADRWGVPLNLAVDLDDVAFAPLTQTDRAGEVAMVVRRPSGKLLLSIKTFYPRAAWRLPTGGIDLGEPIAEALLRETREETGLEFTVSRFLVVVDYRQAGRTGSRFHTFAFLVDETGGTLGSLDPHEQIQGYREIDVAELPAVAQSLATIPDEPSDRVEGSWGAWGRFRAHVHRAVHAALTP